MQENEHIKLSLCVCLMLCMVWALFVVDVSVCFSHAYYHEHNQHVMVLQCHNVNLPKF